MLRGRIRSVPLVVRWLLFRLWAFAEFYVTAVHREPVHDLAALTALQALVAAHGTRLDDIDALLATHGGGIADL